MRRRIRVTLLVVAGVLAALLLALVVAVYLLLQPQRFTDMLRTQAAKAGVQLTLRAPAEPTLWPQPALVLHGLTLSVQGQPMLVAVRGRLVLPWSTLFGGPVAISRLELDAPRLDLGLLRTALAQMPHAEAGGPSLPRIDAGIRIAHGSLVRGGELLLDDLRLETGALLPGQIFSLKMSASTATGRAVRFKLLTTPQAHSDAVDFADLHVSAGSPPDVTASLDGHARWRGGSDIAMQLAGSVQRGNGAGYKLALQLVPAGQDRPFVMHMQLDGTDLHADLHLPPLQLANWWAAVDAADPSGAMPLPPLDGVVEARQLDVGGVHIEGLQLRAGDALPAASSTPAPASSSAVEKP